MLCYCYCQKAVAMDLHLDSNKKHDTSSLFSNVAHHGESFFGVAQVVADASGGQQVGEA